MVWEPGNEGGFTLIEVLIAAFLGAVALLGLTTLYLNGLEFYDEGMGRVELQRQGSLAMEDMARNIRGGMPPPTIVGPDQDRLEFDVPRPDGGTDTLVYFRDGATSSLKFCRDADCNDEVTLVPSTFLPCNVNQLRFEAQDINDDDDDDAVQIEMELELPLKDDRVQRAAFRTTVLLRNPAIAQN